MLTLFASLLILTGLALAIGFWPAALILGGLAALSFACRRYG